MHQSCILAIPYLSHLQEHAGEDVISQGEEGDYFYIAAWITRFGQERLCRVAEGYCADMCRASTCITAFGTVGRIIAFFVIFHDRKVQKCRA